MKSLFSWQWFVEMASHCTLVILQCLEKGGSEIVNGRRTDDVDYL